MHTTTAACHLFDTMTTMYVYNRAALRKVASCAEIKADNSLVLNAVAEGRACPGFLLCGDTADWFAGSAINSCSDGGSGVVDHQLDRQHGPAARPVVQADLGGLAEPAPDASTNADAHGRHRPALPPRGQQRLEGHRQLSRTGSRTARSSPYIHTSQEPTYRRWANGTDTLAPDFRSAGYQAMLEPAAPTSPPTTMTASRRTCTPAPSARTAEAVFKIDVPFYITDANISGDFVKTNAGDVCKVYVSTNGTTWTTGLDATARHHARDQPDPAGQRLRPRGTHLVHQGPAQGHGRQEPTPASATWSSQHLRAQQGRDGLPRQGRQQHHPDLRQPGGTGRPAATSSTSSTSGRNTTAPTGRSTSTTTGYVAASPSTFTINTGGTKVPRTEYILMEVVPAAS